MISELLRGFYVVKSSSCKDGGIDSDEALLSAGAIGRLLLFSNMGAVKERRNEAKVKTALSL